jgi:hypothetical protein
MTRADEDRRKARKSGSRDERLAQALRENLRRRKARERARDVPEPSAKQAPTRPENKGG